MKIETKIKPIEKKGNCWGCGKSISLLKYPDGYCKPCGIKDDEYRSSLTCNECACEHDYCKCEK